VKTESDILYKYNKKHLVPETNADFAIVIIIPTAGRTQLLKNTLHSINKCIKPVNFKGVFVVENGGGKDAKSVVECFDTDYFRYIHYEHKGKSVALNYVIKNYVSDNDLIIFADDDITVNTKWIENYYCNAIKHGRGHYYGGSFDVLYEKEPDREIIPFLPLSARGLSDDAYRLRSVFHGFNWAAFKSDIECAGFFNEDIGPGSNTDSTGDETLLQRKLLSMGCRSVFISNNRVTHFVPEIRSNVQWICHRAVGTGNEKAYNHTGKINPDIYNIFIWAIKITFHFLRGNNYQVNKYLHSLIKGSAKTFILLNRHEIRREDS